ncbi:MAG: hypothetical protein K8R41_01290 [Bacteroidales bacterium]|nr:hypothetical protein [Bacteroidales bacterium]
MNINNRIKAFIKLGEFLKELSTEKESRQINYLSDQYFDSVNKIIKNSKNHNPWFIEKNVHYALNSIAESLKKENILEWIKPYREKLEESNICVNIGVVMAGNIPVVGFHDFLCVLISGNNFVGKLSSQDSELLPAISKILIEIESEFKDKIHFTEEKLQNFEAIIATGSDNTSRYFEYYFGKYPNIIRKNRNGIAVLTGNESKEDLENLGFDIFMHFGLGCRNVSKLFVPEDYSFNQFFNAIEKYKSVKNQSKYINNYDYYKSIYLINKEKHFDNGFLLLREDDSFSSPISVVFYERYENIKELSDRLKSNKENIQCLLANDNKLFASIPFGSGQSPQLWDYADGIDTMEFLLKICNDIKV